MAGIVSTADSEGQFVIKSFSVVVGLCTVRKKHLKKNIY